MAPQAGFEPATLRLTAGCSAVELLRNRAGTASKRTPILTNRDDAGQRGSVRPCARRASSFEADATSGPIAAKRINARPASPPTQVPLFDLVDLAFSGLNEVVVPLHDLLHARVGHRPATEIEVLLERLDLLLRDHRPETLAAHVGHDALRSLHPDLSHHRFHRFEPLDHFSRLARFAVHDFANQIHADLLGDYATLASTVICIVPRYAFDTGHLPSASFATSANCDASSPFRPCAVTSSFDD